MACLPLLARHNKDDKISRFSNAHILYPPYACASIFFRRQTVLSPIPIDSVHLAWVWDSEVWNALCTENTNKLKPN